MIKHFYKFGIIAFLLILITSCKTESAEKSELYNRIFRGEAEIFRGNKPGDPIDSVMLREKGSPKHHDNWGLVYEINLGDGKEGTVEYFQEPSDSLKRLSAIVVNLSLIDEFVTSRLYKEIESELRIRHNVPEGTIGNFIWRDGVREVEVQLRMLDSKNGITLSYTRLI